MDSKLVYTEKYQDGSTWKCWPSAVSVTHRDFGISSAPALKEILDRLSMNGREEKLPTFTFIIDHINKSADDHSAEILEEWDVCSDDLTGAALARALQSHYSFAGTSNGVSTFTRKNQPVFR